MKKLNAKALARLRWMAETLLMSGGRIDRIDGQALTMLLDWHDSGRKEVERLRAALKAMLNHSCVADAGADMKDAEDHVAERMARKALENKQ